MEQLKNSKEMLDFSNDFQEKLNKFNRLLDIIVDVNFKFHKYGKLFNYKKVEAKKVENVPDCDNVIYRKEGNEIFIDYYSYYKFDYYDDTPSYVEVISIPQSFIDIYYKFNFDLYEEKNSKIDDINYKINKLKQSCYVSQYVLEDINKSLLPLKELQLSNTTKYNRAKRILNKYVKLLKNGEDVFDIVKEKQLILTKTKKQKDRLDKIYSKKKRLKKYFYEKCEIAKVQQELDKLNIKKAQLKIEKEILVNDVLSKINI